MKIQPTTFVQEYDEHGYGQQTDTYPGFIPYYDNKKYYYKIKIEMVARKWCSGSVLCFDVYRMTNGAYENIRSLSRDVYTNKWLSQKEVEEFGHIIPNCDQSQLIEALASGDLRGRYAEDIAYRLYVELFLLHPYSGIKQELPKVIEETLKRRNSK